METSTRQEPRNTGRYITLVKNNFKKDYKIPGLEYQENGIVVRETWASKPSILRLLPGWDPATGEVFRQNTDEQWSPDGSQTMYLSNTFYMCKTCFRFGESRHDVIVDLEPGSEDATRFQSSPIREFTESIYGACRSEQNGRRHRLKSIPVWKSWTGQDGTLPYARDTFLMQALAFEVNGRGFRKGETDIVDESGAPLPLLCLLGMTHRTSMNMLISSLVEPSNPGLPLDAQTNNKYGAFAEAQGNLLYLNVAVDKDDRKYLRPSVQPPDTKGWTATPYDLEDEMVRQWWTPWKDLLRFLTVDEQLDLLAKEFGADTVNYVIGTDNNFAGLVMPEAIAAAGLGRYASAEGAGVRAGVAPGRIPVRAAGLPAAGVQRPGAAPARPAAPAAAPAKPVQVPARPAAGTVVPPAPQRPAAVTPPARVAAPARATAPGGAVAGMVNREGLKAELNKMKATGIVSPTAIDQEDPSSLAGQLLEGDEAGGDYVDVDVVEDPNNAGE